jgi:hypothetical protein
LIRCGIRAVIDILACIIELVIRLDLFEARYQRFVLTRGRVNVESRKGRVQYCKHQQTLPIIVSIPEHLASATKLFQLQKILCPACDVALSNVDFVGRAI